MSHNSEIMFDFDRAPVRQGTGSRKWDALDSVFGKGDILPLWIADMDFASPPAVAERLQARAAHPIYAYNTQDESLYEAFRAWVKQRHGWQVERDWLLVAPGVVPSVILAITALSKPGDGIIIQPPVYPPFFDSIRDNQRIIVENPLLDDNGYYTIDYVDLEKKLADPQNKLLLLCSPHNPVGRVWSREELAKVYALCRQYDVDVLADEIHSDLIYRQRRHTVFASLDETAAKASVTFMAGSKTFNLAGLNLSFIVVPCSRRRALLEAEFTRLHIRRNNLFGVLASEAAYSSGQAWLESVLAYLEANADTLVDFVNIRLPKLRVVKPEGTYLAWLDFRAYFADSKQLDAFLINRAGVGLNSGKNFGKQGEGFARLNFATQRTVLLEALQRIERALKLEFGENA
ncbi:MAG: PatB family C-S lyase [Sporomusaceae bacterium]|nr:PatB family C-S lyase [Sporomusaceae bacterium]